MWQHLLFWVITTVISSLLAPKPKVENAKPGQIGEKDIPMVRADAPIPVVFGTRVLSQPNVVWWGDVRTEPIMAKAGGKK